MTDALKKAAEEASAVTGLSVELHPLCSSGPPALGDENITYHVELYAPIDSDTQEPIRSRTCFGSAAALAYLNGLETGARIQRERALDIAEDYLTPEGHDAFRKALSNLEG